MPGAFFKRYDMEKYCGIPYYNNKIFSDGTFQRKPGTLARG